MIERPSDVLWYATAPPVPDRPVLEDDIAVDVAVIGGGFTGLATTLHLADAGHSVALLECGPLAWGASGRNAGVVAPMLARGDPDDILHRLGEDQGTRLVELIAGAGNVVFELAARTGADCGAQQTGFLQPAHAPAALPALKRRVEQWQERGKPVHLLDRHEVAEVTGTRCFAGALLDPSGGQIHPVKLVLGLAALAEAQGATLYEGTPVSGLIETDAGWRLQTPGGAVSAARVVLATNAHVGDLWPGLERTIMPLVIHQLATKPVDRATADRLLPGRQAATDTRALPFSFRFDGDNRLISAGLAPLPIAATARMDRLVRRQLRRLLEIETLPPTAYIWSGRAALTGDFLPRLHRLAPGLVAALGFNGRGIALTLALGRVLSDLVLERGDPLPLPLDPVKPMAAHWLVRHGPRVYIPWARYKDARDTKQTGTP